VVLSINSSTFANDQGKTLLRSSTNNIDVNSVTFQNNVRYLRQNGNSAASYLQVNGGSGIVVAATQRIPGVAPLVVQIGSIDDTDHTGYFPIRVGTSATVSNESTNVELLLRDGLTTTATTGTTTITVRGAGDTTISGARTPTTSGPTATGVVDNGSGQVAISKNDAGRLLLDGPNSYTGGTAVSAGSLLINGDNRAASGPVTVAFGATFGGTSMIGGSTAIAGTHTPGNSPGLQTFINGLAYDATATLVWELSANTAASGDRGTLYDAIDLTTAGALAINPAATISLVFDEGASIVDWDDPLWTANQAWQVIDNAAPVTWDGTMFGALLVGNDSTGASLAAKRSGASFSLMQQDGDLLVAYTVPEPRLAAALAAFAGVIMARPRLRRRAGTHP